MSQFFLLNTTFQTRLINFLLKKRVNVFYHWCKDQIKGRKKSDQWEVIATSIHPGEFHPSGIREIQPVSETTHGFLLKPLYDFVYAQNEPVRNIKVFELVEGSTYVFLGSQEGQRLEFSPS